MRSVLGIDLMEVETVSFGYVSTPLKELPPRRIRNALAEVLILNHVRDAEIFSDKDIIFQMMKKFVDEFSNEIFAFVRGSLMV